MRMMMESIFWRYLRGGLVDLWVSIARVETYTENSKLD